MPGAVADARLDQYSRTGSRCESSWPWAPAPNNASLEATDRSEAWRTSTLTRIGPVDYLVIGFPVGKANFSGEIASELKRRIDGNTIRLLDLVMIIRGEDGSVEASELRDADDNEVDKLRGAGARPRDPARRKRHQRDRRITRARQSCPAGLGEHVAAPFGSAVRRSGGELLANGRIPTQALVAAVDADRQAANERA